MREDRDEKRYVAQEGDRGSYQTHLRACADAIPVEDAQQSEGPNRSHQGKGPDSRKDDAEIEYSRKTADGGREKIIDEDEHAPESADPVIHGLGRDRDDAAA